MHSPVNYSEYLKLKELLNCQKRKSEEINRPAHDEMLFIIVHQAYELWFKQILFEFNSIIDLFQAERIDERNIGLVNARLDRVIRIQYLLVNQLSIIESMTPLDFLEFRDLLIPASGFQSQQFREIENKMGLRNSDRVSFVGGPLLFKKTTGSSTDERDSLFYLLDRWLKRTPFLKFQDFDFLNSYRTAVQEMLEKDKEIIQENQTLSPEGKEKQLESLQATQQSFDSLLNKEKYEKLLKEGRRRLSYESYLAALLIFLYRDRPLLQQPYQLLTQLIDIDEHWTTWRYRHALMVHRMIGTKIGTGGSSGHEYLKMSAERHKVFVDLYDISTFLIPRSSLPKLPEAVEKNLNFVYSQAR